MNSASATKAITKPALTEPKRIRWRTFRIARKGDKPSERERRYRGD